MILAEMLWNIHSMVNSLNLILFFARFLKTSLIDIWSTRDILIASHHFLVQGSIDFQIAEIIQHQNTVDKRYPDFSALTHKDTADYFVSNIESQLCQNFEVDDLSSNDHYAIMTQLNFGISKCMSPVD